MSKRFCYLHIGPPKTGTSAIQWYLKEQRSELLKHGYLVPESGCGQRGNHLALISHLWGSPRPTWRSHNAKNFARELANTSAEAVVISSEALNGLLARSDGRADGLFASLSELNLEPRIVVLPRHQPQWFNSSYCQKVKTFRFAGRIEEHIRHTMQRAQFARLTSLASARRVALIARPYTSANARDVVPAFLEAIGLNVSQFPIADRPRRNESVGPFTVAVARQAMTEIGEMLPNRQAIRCGRRFEHYMASRQIDDASYNGLSSELRADIERSCRADNDAFALEVWGAPWHEIFAADFGKDSNPNDYDIVGMPDSIAPMFNVVVAEIATMMREELAIRSHNKSL